MENQDVTVNNPPATVMSAHGDGGAGRSPGMMARKRKAASTSGSGGGGGGGGGGAGDAAAAAGRGAAVSSMDGHPCETARTRALMESPTNVGELCGGGGGNSLHHAHHQHHFPHHQPHHLLPQQASRGVAGVTRQLDFSPVLGTPAGAAAAAAAPPAPPVPAASPSAESGERGDARTPPLRSTAGASPGSSASSVSAHSLTPASGGGVGGRDASDASITADEGLEGSGGGGAPAAPEQQQDAAAQQAEDDEAATLRLVQQLMEQEEQNRLREWEEAQMQQVLAMSSAANMAALEGEDADLAMALRMQREEGGLSEQAAEGLGGAVAALAAAEGAEGGGGDGGAEDGEEAGGLDVDNMDYDQLLTLGQQLGDVKTERWAAVAAVHIAKLPTFEFAPAKAAGEAGAQPGTGTAATSGDHMCCVCQCDFEEKEELMQLPCDHTFHAECISTWLGQHSTCCVCKASIVKSPSGSPAQAKAAPASPAAAAGGVAASTAPAAVSS